MQRLLLPGSQVEDDWLREQLGLSKSTGRLFAQLRVCANCSP
jgi:hypothetical protein